MVESPTGIQLGGTARTPEDVISLWKLELDFAEIPLTNPDRYHRHKERYLALKREFGLFFLCHGPREGDPNDRKALENVYLPRLFDVLALLPELEINLLTFHLWFDPRFVRKEAIMYKREFLRRLTERAMDLGIQVCLENLSEKAEDLAGVLMEVERLGLTLDVGHAQLLTEGNTSFDIIEQFADRIKHLHLHDNHGGDSPSDDLHLPVGEGIIAFEPIFRKLAAAGYSRTVTLELRPREIEACLPKVKKLFHILDSGQGISSRFKMDC